MVGIQKIKDVILIRHAYTLTSYQGRGTGSTLLKYLLKKNQTTQLLKKYWKIPSQQIENSVVLERQLRNN